MPLLRALQDVGSLTPPPAYSNPGPHASTRLIDIYSIVGAIFCIASLLAAAAVIWKLARRPMLLSTSGRSVTQGPHSMKRFMDSVVLVMSVIDVVFAAVLVTTLIATWRLWYFQGVQNHWVWWAFAQFCWLPQFYHCYIASVCFNWVVRKHSVARLQRAFRPSLVGIVLAVLLQTTLALSLNGWDTRTGESFTLAKTIAYIEYLAVHVCTQMTLLWFYIRSCWSLVGHLRGGQRVNKPYRKIVWRFMKMCAMSLIVWSFWTAVMFMWYTVFTTQLVVIMFLTLPVWIYPFLDAMLMGNIFELYRRGPSSEEHRQRGPVTVASTSVKCLESRAGAWRASQEGLGHSSYAFRGKIRREETSASERGASTATIFTSTLNLGGVKDIAHLGGSLEEWLPPGYDVYCIGVQECIILDDLRQALHEHLGGPSEYTMFQADVGAATMLYGTIALTAFARASDVQRGAFSAIDALTSRVKNGVNLVVTKTANKGMVGLAFRYHDSTLAFVTAHFASDSGGKTRLKRRNGDAYVLLRALNLTDTEEGFDFHLEHHHTFVMGDLNYRMKTDAASMITRIAAAATRAKGILNDGFSQTSDAFQPSMQGLGFLGEEEDRDGRNVRFGFPSFDEKMEDAPSSHRDLASTPAPQEEAGVEWREEGQMSWVREKYLRLYPRGAPGDGGSRSPLGLVLRRRWSSGLSVLSMQPEGSVERQGSCQFPQEVERDEDILTDSDEEEDSGDEWEEKEDEAGAGEAEVEVPEQEEEQEKMEEEEEVEEVEEDEEEEEVGDTVEDEGWDAEETKEERATTDTTKTNQSHDGLSQRSRHWLTLRNSLRGIKASDKSPLASKASPQDFPASPSRRAILGRRFGWPGRKRGAARGRSHHRLRRREREEDGREGGREEEGEDGEIYGGETSGYFPADSEASGGDTSGPTYSSLPSYPTSSPPSQADRHQGRRRPSSPSEGHSSSASGGNDVFVSGSYSSAGHRSRSSSSNHVVVSIPPTITTAPSLTPSEGKKSDGEGRRGRKRGSKRRLRLKRVKPQRKEKPRVAHAWTWVRELDELQCEMKAGRVFSGFSEGEIAFPPSFRWRRGAIAGDFTDEERLAASYVLHKKGDGQRVPSYTDRILFHSLADVRGSLSLVAYELCDALTGSDHRPVSAAFELRLNKKVIGFRTMPSLKGDSSSTLPVSGRMQGPRGYPAVSSLGVEGEEGEREEGKEEGGRQIPTTPAPFLGAITPAIEYPTASVWSVRLSNASYDPIKDLAAREDTEGPVGTTVNVMHPNCKANADWTLTIHFPSLLEDPFAHDRKMRLLQEAMDEGGREATVSRETLKSLLQTPRQDHLRQQQLQLQRGLSLTLPPPQWDAKCRASGGSIIDAAALGTAFGQAAALTTRAHQAEWGQVSQPEGTSFKVLVLPEVSRHALIRVTDSRGREVGQGVMCLRQAFPTSVRSSSSSSFSLSEGGKEEDGGVMGAPVQALRRLVGGDREKEKKRRKGGEKRLEVPLSLGGRAAGVLRLSIRIHKRDYEYNMAEQQKGKEEKGRHENGEQSRNPWKSMAAAVGGWWHGEKRAQQGWNEDEGEQKEKETGVESDSPRATPDAAVYHEGGNHDI